MSGALQLPKAVEDALLELNPAASRRSFLKASGALVISLGVTALARRQRARGGAGAARAPIPIPTSCSSTPGS